MALEEYTPQTDFSQDEANQVSGRSTVRTTNLDAEFANLQTSIDSLIARLRVISRDDDALQDGIVTIESLAADVLALIGDAGFNPMGPWLTATSYERSDLVSEGTGTYVCAEAHTSGVFATDLAAGKWIMLFDTATVAASSVTFSPAGGIIASDVQSAIVELDTEKMAKAANGSDIANAATFRGNISVPSKAEAQNQAYTYAEDTGTSDALSATLGSSPPTAYTTGLFATVKKTTSANSSTAPTLDWCGLGPKTIFSRGGRAVVAGDLPESAHLDFQYDEALDGAVGGWELKNPYGSTATGASIAFSGVITPAQITAHQDNYSPAGMSSASGMRLDANAAYELRGIAGGSIGRIMTLHNIGAHDITLMNEAGTSTASNRFSFVADVVLSAGKSLMLQYDGVSARWRVFNEAEAAATFTSTYNFESLI